MEMEYSSKDFKVGYPYRVVLVRGQIIKGVVLSASRDDVIFMQDNAKCYWSFPTVHVTRVKKIPPPP